MEHPVTAAVAGIVNEVHVTVGQYVEARAVLVSLAPEETV